MEHKHLHAVAVIDADNRPVGIINRRDFSEHYAQRYTRELFGRDTCSTFMNGEPVLVDLNVSIDQLSHVLISEDQRYLMDGLIITRDGRYDGWPPARRWCARSPRCASRPPATPTR